MPGVRELADTFHERWLATHPFSASNYGVPGYDDRVPDDSEAGEDSRRSELESTLVEAGRLEHASLSEPDSITLACLRENVAGEQAAVDYLDRLRAGGTWIDQQTERLRIGAAKGRLPVAPLVREAIEWAEYVLGPAVPEALATPEPPAGWDGEPAWREERDGLAAGAVKPALARWLELLRELLPRAR